MKRFLTLILSTLFGAVAFAGTITINVVQPTQYTDNTPILAGEITQTRAEYGTCNGVLFGTKAGEVIAAGPATSISKSGLTAGDYCTQVFTTAKGVESLASNVVKVTVPQAGPKPPTITATATLAMTVKKRGSGWDLVDNVGTVKLGTPCDATKFYGNGGYYGIDPKAVSFYQGRSATRVAARCG